MTKQIHVITIVLIILAVIAVGTVAYFKFSTEDTWLCQNGGWVKHGNPSSAMPTAGCDASVNNNNNSAPTESNIKIDNLKAGDTITTPLTLTGSARGWYFEASFPIKLLDATGKELATAPAQAQGEWMNSNWVPFKATLNFISPTDQNGTLVFMKDNPSGLPANDEKFEIPVLIKATETLVVKAFFGNTLKNPDATDCSLVYPLDRTIAKTQATGQASLAELIAGPTEAEKAQGYYTSINPGVQLQKLTITNGTAYADFNETLEAQVGGSCKITFIRAQITQTLLQFPTVKNMVISIDGRTEDILQP
jgi:hypothetical protein